MTKRSIITSMLLLWGIFGFSQTVDVDTLIVRFFSWDMDDSPHAVRPLNFEYEVPYKEYIITDDSVISSIRTALKNEQKGISDSFNVGCKLIFVKNGNVESVVSMNSDYIRYKGKVFLNNSTKEIIDNIFNVHKENRILDKYLPDRNESEYIGGKEELFNLLSSNFPKILNGIELKNDVKFRVRCKASTNGKTLCADIDVYGSCSQDEKNVIRKRLKSFFLHNVRWKRNLDRTKNDIITILYKVSPRKGSQGQVP